MPRRMTVKVGFVTPADGGMDPEIVWFWESCLSANNNPNVLFQSPEWLASLERTQSSDEPSLAFARGNDGKLQSLAAMRLRSDALPLRIGRLKLPTQVIRSAEILGGEPLLAHPQSVSDFDSLAHAIIDMRPQLDGLYFHMLRIGSPLWKHLTLAPSLRNRFVPVVKLASILYLTRPVGTFHDLILQSSSKERLSLRRSVQRLQEYSGSALMIERITQREDVPRFLRLGGAVAAKSWQSGRVNWLIKDTPQWYDHLADLADQKLLRSYLLTCGETPYSYVLGFQGRGTFYHKNTGYDPAFKQWAPGIVLHNMLMEDLFAHARPSLVHFGFGDNPYKRIYVDDGVRVAHLFLLRKTLWSRLKCFSEVTKWR